MDINDLQKYLEKMDTESKANHKESQHEFKKMNETLVRNTISLETHVKRTNLLEKRIEQVQEDIRPVHDHVTKVEFFFKTMKWIGIPTVLSGIGYAITLFISK